MKAFFLLCFAQYAAIGLKAFQQLNVMHSRVTWGAATSYALAVFDVFVVVATVQAGWQPSTILALGTGGALGVASAVYFHKRLRDHNANH